MKETKKLMSALITTVLMISLAFAVYAQGSPQLPHLFYGTAKVNGNDLPSGSVIIAKVSNVEKGRITTTEAGKYGGPSGSDDKLLVQGSIDENAEIKFFVNNIAANEVAQFESGKIENKSLTWAFPDVIEFDAPLANEPYTCMPGTDIEINLPGLTLTIECDTAEAGIINNVSNLGTGFLIGAPAPGGLEEISSVFEISIAGDVEIIVTMSYDPTGIDESTVAPYKFVNGAWVAVTPFTRDTVANTVTFNVAPGGTPYTLFGSAPAPVEAAPTGGAVAGGGGGGGGGCTYDWQCTEWSACQPNGKQARTCTNEGTCLGTAGKPAEEQSCTYTSPAGGEEEEAAIPEEEAAPGEAAPPTTGGGLAGITGRAIQNIFGSGANAAIGIFIIILIVVGGLVFYNKVWKKRK